MRQSYHSSAVLTLQVIELMCKHQVIWVTQDNKQIHDDLNELVCKYLRLAKQKCPKLKTDSRMIY